ncbi:MAG: hypothetical protein ACI4O7_07615 [Aristaeellaceae bacterium]
MKKLTSLILSLMLLTMMLPVSALAASAEDMVGENIVYQIHGYHWEGQKLYVQGCIANLNTAYDLLGMENAVMVLTDANGLELCYINVNEAVANSCILQPLSKTPYNFTVKTLLHDRSEYASLTSGLHVYFVSFSYQYAACEGAQCPYCQHQGLALSVNPFDIVSGSADNTYPCYMCYKGKCPGCGGDGRFEALKGSIWGDRCRTCEGDGKCPACGGDGIMGN